MATVLAQPHRRWLPPEMRAHERAETLVGCLYLNDDLDKAQILASDALIQIVSDYRSVIASWDPLRRAGGRSGRDVAPEEADRRTRAYNDAYTAIGGHKEQRAVSRVVIYRDGLPGGCTLDHLRSGLQGLAVHLGLTRAAERANGEIVRTKFRARSQ